jgi:ketosteroid isomerase-like protein
MAGSSRRTRRDLDAILDHFAENVRFVTPTGDAVRMHGADLVTVHEGRFTEFHAYWNTVG